MIDINCDLAEGGAYDERLMPLISSCNIACGGHFGDTYTIETAVRLALRHHVNIGAHPSYPDTENFGRKTIDIELKELKKSLKGQIVLVKDIAERLGGRLHHVKPHGALYNELKHHKEKSHMIIDLIQEIDDNLVLFVSPKSILKELANNKVKTFTEGFADRAYQSDFSLVPRVETGAVLEDKFVIANRVKKMIRNHEIITHNGEILQQKFDTICVHSDTQNSVEILEHIQQQIKTITP